MSDRREGAAKAAADAEKDGIPPFLSDAQIRWLKVAVVVMGIILILGFVVVVMRIVQLSQRATLPTAAPAAGAPAAAARRPDVTLPLPAGAMVRGVSSQGDRLLVHYDAPSGAGIVIVDLATGAMQRVTVVTGAQ